MKKIIILGKFESANKVTAELINFLYNFDIETYTSFEEADFTGLIPSLIIIENLDIKDETNKNNINEILSKRGIPIIIISNDEEALEFPHPAVNLPRPINYDNLLKIIRLLT